MYGLVIEQIKTLDKTNRICTQCVRALPRGGLSMFEPPTTLSATGIDRMAFAQANITRDNTKFVNGAVVGEQDVFHVSFRFWNNIIFFWAFSLIDDCWYQMRVASFTN